MAPPIPADPSRLLARERISTVAPSALIPLTAD